MGFNFIVSVNRKYISGLPLWFMIPKNVSVSFRVQVLVFYSGTMAIFMFDGLLFSWK